MRIQHLWTISVILGLLCSAASGADPTCGLKLGDRVELTVNHPDGHPTLHAGHRGTVICFHMTPTWWQTVLVSWDNWVAGHENTGWCTTPFLLHTSHSCWWVYCNQIKPVEQRPDLFDSGEPDRSFRPQTLISGKAKQILEVIFNVVNGGRGNPSKPIYVKVYASTDPTITPSDYLLGTAGGFFISGGGSLKKTLKATFPTNIPAGFYYVGWIIDPDNKVDNELDETNNRAYVESYRLLVSGPPDTPSLELSAALGGQIVSPGEGVFTYPGTEDVWVEAAADPNCTFVEWTGTAVDAGMVFDVYAPDTQVTVDARYNLKAVFDGPHMMLEDFEGYNDPCTPLNAVWVDGMGWRIGDPKGHRGNETGATIGSAEAPATESGTVREGLVMVFDYNNRRSPYYSEASRRWGTLQNWVATGADKLSIWYCGAPSNTPQPLYTIIEDFYQAAAVVQHPDSQAVLASEWTQWTIPLEEIKTQGVMLSRVIKISLGVGEKGDIFSAGAGTLYFDDIALAHK